MAAKREISDLKRDLSIVDVVGRSVELKKDGREYRALCPFHSEKTPSFSVVPDKGFYHCFGCGAHGDVLDFVAEIHGIDRDSKGWLDQVRHHLGEPGSAPVVARIDPPPPPWRPLVPVPEGAPPLVEEGGRTAEIVNPKRAGTKRERTRLRPVSSYPYRLPDGSLIGYVLRCEIEGGGKFTPQITYCAGPDGERAWAMVSLPEPRPLLGADELARRPGDPVLVVEGEKAWAAARELAPQYVAVTWPGGTAVAGRATWSLLAGRRVLIWPDADAEGLRAAASILEALTASGCKVRLIDVAGLAKGWDAADALEDGMDPAGWRKWASERARKPEAGGAPAQGEAAGGSDSDPEPAQETGDVPQFRCLGYDSGAYYAMPYASRQVTAIPVGALTSKSYLLHLAPLEWWGDRFGDKNGKPVWEAAANAFARWCERVGPFDASRIRGRGAWHDEGRSVLHLGHRLIVDGESVEIEDFRTRYIYESAPSMEDDRDQAEPATAAQGEEIYRVFQHLNWAGPVHGPLLAGWAALAPVCGALRWRPHVWVTGRRGSGKSWLIDQIVRPVVGETAVIVQSTSTEAGIRQKMRQDARPLLFDEAEAENRQDLRRVQSVIELARQASSESSAEIAKGTVGGRGLSFRTRSMFLMGSINVPLHQAADKSRFTVLSLLNPPSGTAGTRQFEELQNMVNEVITPERCAALRARIYRMIPVIRKNAATFARAAAEVLGSQRAGDQLGALLAGAYAMQRDGEVALEAARAWVKAQSWDEQVEAEDEGDERALLDEILSHQVRVEGNPGFNGGPQYLQRSIGELVAIAAGSSGALGGEIPRETAEDVLRRHGLMVVGEELLVSHSHAEVRKILQSTPWAGGWVRILGRLPGANQARSARFAGVQQRAVGIPISSLL